jgi:hypothetical protein
MSAESILPVIAGLGWLLLTGSALASFRLGWSRLAKMALVWAAIFTGLTLLVMGIQTA